jgi:hypothetical protein
MRKSVKGLKNMPKGVMKKNPMENDRTRSRRMRKSKNGFAPCIGQVIVKTPPKVIRLCHLIRA